MTIQNKGQVVFDNGRKKTFGCIWPNARKISGRAAERFAPENLRESGRLPELLNSVNISLEVMS